MLYKCTSLKAPDISAHLVVSGDAAAILRPRRQRRCDRSVGGSVQCNYITAEFPTHASAPARTETPSGSGRRVSLGVSALTRNSYTILVEICDLNVTTFHCKYCT